MIIHKLIAQHLKGGDNADFYLLQARDAIAWLERSGVAANSSVTALDLGCGHGIFGAELIQRGCRVTFADEQNFLPSELATAPFRQVNLDHDELREVGRFDLVICSNVLEHLSKPARFIAGVKELMSLHGYLYLSWTNWLSPWGGHEFSPFHYLGARRGHLLHDRITGRARKHTPFSNLFPTYIGQVLRLVKQQRALKILRAVPRYYPELAFLTRVPILREVMTWNCAILVQRVE